METFSALLAICAGNSPVPVNSPHNGQWRGALMFFFICAWINSWLNNREAGDLRSHRAHYDVIVMLMNFHQISLKYYPRGTCDNKTEMVLVMLWRGTLMFSLICAWINDWVNNRKAGDLRPYCAHYDVIVMLANEIVVLLMWSVLLYCAWKLVENVSQVHAM